MNLPIVISIFLIAAVNFSALGQIQESTYKTFLDSVYEPGDKIISPRILFSLSGGMAVLPQTYDSLKVIADFMVLHPNALIEIGGHTDSRGDEESNQQLSYRRAKSVKFELVERFGILPERIQIKGYGELLPMVPFNIILEAESKEKKEELHAKNRRIEIMIIEF